MELFKVQGGRSLKGTVTPQGAKNEALQVLSAVLLTDEKVTISNVPNIIDVLKLIEILKHVGVRVAKLSNDTYTFTADNVDTDYLNSNDFKKKAGSIRGSIMIMGPLLARFGQSSITKPGGDKIGRRRLDTHFEGFLKLGSSFTYDRKTHVYTLKADRLNGADILLDEASITGTANIVMAAVLAQGTTTIYNAACEPYLQQLCKMLNRMGADIQGIGSNLLRIKGVKKLKGTTHRILPDMIEIGSWIGIAAMTCSELTIKNVSWENLGQIPYIFRKIRHTIGKETGRYLYPQTGILSNTNGYRWLYFNHFGCALARFYSRFVEHRSGGCHSSKRKRFDPSENV